METVTPCPTAMTVPISKAAMIAGTVTGNAGYAAFESVPLGVAAALGLLLLLFGEELAVWWLGRSPPAGKSRSVDKKP